MEDKNIKALAQIKQIRLDVTNVASKCITVTRYPTNDEPGLIILKKREKCLYCGEPMESQKASKKFCSTLHRISYFRAKNRWINQQKKMAAEGNNS